MTELKFIGGVSRPDPWPVTEPFRRFIGFYETMNHFNGLVIQLASLAPPHKPDALSPYALFVNTSTLAAGVNNYLTYISELLTLCFETQPALMHEVRGFSRELRETDQKGRELLGDLGEIVEYLVFNLTRHGIRNLTNTLSEKFGFDLYPTEEMQGMMPYYVDVRNLIVHRRGVVSHYFIRKYPEHEKDQGMLVHFHTPFVGNALLDTNSSALGIDERAAERFSLARPHMVRGEDGGF